MATRDRLLEAAILMLRERGYARTTTRQIVEAADTHLPSVSYFFGSKEGLMDAAVEEALRRWTTETLDAVGSIDAADPRERLRVSVDQFLSTLTADRGVAVAAIEAFAQVERNDELRDRLAQAYRDFRLLIAKAASEDHGAGSPADATALASVVIALFDGLAIQWLLSPDDVPDTTAVMNSLGFLGSLLDDRHGATAVDAARTD